MCGRYTLRRPGLLRKYVYQSEFDEFSELHITPRFNIAPTQHVPVVRLDEGKNAITLMKWGLIPFWTKGKPKMQPINARAETLRTSPMFREGLVKRRCLMPVDGFYEWQGAKPPKQPYFIHCPDDQPFVFAAIWESWKPEPDAEPVETCCLITTTPNDTMGAIHNRMPVILDDAGSAAWLDTASSANTLKELMRPAPDGLLELRPVSTAVNNVRNDVAELVEPLAPPASNSE